jgi:YggT family protein
MTFPQSILHFFVVNGISVLIALIFIQVILSWLLAFNIINLRNQIVAQIYYGIEKFLGPIYRPIRNVLPSMGGLDLSPIILLFALYWLRDYVVKGVLIPMFG